MVERGLPHLHRGGGVGPAQPQWLMEIDVTAVIPDDWQGGGRMTLSLTARCPETGQLGIAISSSSMAVGSRCPWLLPGVGRFPARILPCRRWGRRSSARSRRGPALSRP